MLIVIPTYKRNTCLKWVLQSLVQCHTDGVYEPIRVLVVNNYPPARNEISEIVDGFKTFRKFEWDILYRKYTLPPVENWYSAILDFALPNEIVVINSDDDLFLPWSLNDKYKELNRTSADLLLAKIDGGLWFSQNAEIALYKSKLPNNNMVSATPLVMSEVFYYAPQHLSNHCYRNTQTFREALNKAFTWCHNQEWLDFNNRTLFITLYLPYSIIFLNGVVSGLDKICTLRGIDVDEIRVEKFGISSWNHGFIHLCAIDVLNNDDLIQFSELDGVRKIFNDTFTRWFCTYFSDPRVGCIKLVRTIMNSKYKITDLLSIKIFYGLYLLFKDIFKLNGYSLEKECKLNGIFTEDLLKNMQNL